MKEQIEVEATTGSVSAGRWRRGFAWGAGLAATVLLAGVVSFYASSSPDGLEWVAAQAGFINTATEHAAVTYSPLADYQLSGVEGQRLSGGLAGIIGTSVVLGLSLGLMWLLAKRNTKRV